MPDRERIDLAQYRLERAKECLKTAEVLYGMEDYRTVANRSYYAIFHAIRAVLALDGVDRKKHSGVIAYFQEQYIKTGQFEKQYSAVLKNAFLVRQESDYEDFYIISKEEVKRQMDDAKQFVEEIARYLSESI